MKMLCLCMWCIACWLTKQLLYKIDGWLNLMIADTTPCVDLKKKTLVILYTTVYLEFSYLPDVPMAENENIYKTYKA